MTNQTMRTGLVVRLGMQGVLQYRNAAGEVIKEVQARGSVPINLGQVAKQQAGVKPQ